MKVKFNLRSVLLALIPWLHVSLIMAPIFAYAAFYIWQMEILPAYLLGLSLIIPVALTRLMILKIRNFAVYIIVSLVLSALWFLLNPILGVVVTLLWVIRLAGRLRSGNKTVFDSPHYAGIAAFLMPFICSAADGLPQLQLIALVSALVYGFMTLVYISLKRLEDYIQLNQTMADFPQKRVGSTTMKTVLTLAAVMFALSLVLLLVNFRFFYIPELVNPGAELAQGKISEDELFGGFENQMNLPQFENNPLNINWTVIGRVLVSLVAAVIIIVVALVVWRMAQNFADTNVRREEKDTIEVIKNEEEKLIAEKHSFIPDFSPNAYVRRKYRRAVKSKNYEPSPWQSPEEIERSAGIDNELIHCLYEKARYSREGCSSEDKKLL